MNKILYLDVDNVLVDFESALATLPAETLQQYASRFDEVPGIFSRMQAQREIVDE